MQKYIDFCYSAQLELNKDIALKFDAFSFVIPFVYRHIISLRNVILAA